MYKLGRRYFFNLLIFSKKPRMGVWHSGYPACGLLPAYVGVLAFKSQLPSPLSFPATAHPGGSGEGSSTWVSVKHLGDPG